MPILLSRWPQARSLEVAARVSLVFLPLDTPAHFTNIKPDFMLDLFAEEALGIGHLFYIDPDICVVRDWQFLADWATCGVGLCEDVNSPLSENHPRRVGWRRYFGDRGIALSYRGSAYVNGGCVSVARADARFLEDWRSLMRHMADIIGDLGAAKIEGGKKITQNGFAMCFDSSDQDALNATVEMCDGMHYSILPQSAMAFAHGATILPHALGPAKPWRKNYLREMLIARRPGPPDHAFWANVDGPLRSTGAARIRMTRLSLGVSSAVARFYRKSGL
jgi:hypothetical protein